MTASTLFDNNPSLCQTSPEMHFDRVQVREVVERVETRLEIVGIGWRAVMRYNAIVYLEVIKRNEMIS
jgi:hypothetical protein